MGAVGRTEAACVLEANAGCVAAAEDYAIFQKIRLRLMVTPCPYRDLRDYVYGF